MIYAVSIHQGGIFLLTFSALYDKIIKEKFSISVKVYKMKKALKVTSFLCLLVAVLSVIFGIVTLTSANRSFFVGFAMFNVIRSGTFMGFIGNLIGMALTFASFGLMVFFSLKGKDKNALIWSLIAIVLSVISLVIVLIGKMMSFGDIIITLLPVAHLFLIFKNTDV